MDVDQQQNNNMALPLCIGQSEICEQHAEMPYYLSVNFYFIEAMGMRQFVFLTEL